MPLVALKVVGIPPNRIAEQPVDIYDFGGNAFTLSYNNIDLITGPI